MASAMTVHMLWLAAEVHRGCEAAEGVYNAHPYNDEFKIFIGVGAVE